MRYNRDIQFLFNGGADTFTRSDSDVKTDPRCVVAKFGAWRSLDICCLVTTRWLTDLDKVDKRIQK